MIFKGSIVTPGRYSSIYPFILTVLLCAFFTFSALSQETEKGLLEAEKSIVESKDTLVEKKDFTLRNLNYQTDPGKTNSFYDSLKLKASRKNWTKELHNAFISSPNPESPDKKHSNQKSADNFFTYRDFYIRDIHLKKIDVFGPEVYDTTLKATSKIEQFANKMHFKTIDRIIKNNIIVREGEKLNPYQLSDNERVLRELSYIHDARIEVNTVPGTDSVDLTYIVKDVWSKGFGIDIASLTSGKLEAWDRNIFGTGHENQNMIYWNSEKQPKFGYEGAYKIKNLGGSFINGEVHYTNVFDKEIYQVNFMRRFVTPRTKYAGGAIYNKTNADEPIWFLDSTFIHPLQFTHYNYWMGRSFLISEQGKFNNGRSNLIFVASYDNYKFTEAPVIEENLFYRYRTRSTLLASISYTQQKYFKTNYLYSFGRTEDIPTGMMIEYTGGTEKNPDGHRVYNRLNFSYGNYLLNAGYLYSNIDIGGFYCPQYGIEQGVLRARVNYFTKLIKLHKFRFRQFATIRYTQGINSNYNEFVTLNRNSGIRGFTSDFLRDQQKLVINAESVYFSPLYIYGFRFVLYNFFDVGFIGPSNQNIFTNRIQTGIGVGIRVRNERLVFRTFQLQFAYYPNAPADARNALLDVSGEPRLRPDNFIPTSPSVLTF